MFKPLEFVTNKFARSSSRASASKNNRRTAAACDVDDSSTSDSDSHHVRFEMPSSDSELELELGDSQDFLLRKKDCGGRENRPKRSAALKNVATAERNTTHNTSPPQSGKLNSPPKTSTNQHTANVRTPSPERSIAKNISPPSTIADVSPSRTTDKESFPVEKKNYRDTEAAISATDTINHEKTHESTIASSSANKNKSDQPKATSTTATDANASTSGQEAMKGSVTPTPKKKKRMSVYEQLPEDAQVASERLKEDADEALRFKRQVHKEKLKDIREKEDELKKLGDQLKKLRDTASDLEQQIKEDAEKKKLAARVGNNLRRTTTRAIKKAVKDREDARANIKAKDAVLKQALKDAKSRRVAEDSEDEGAKGSAKKKRKVSPGEKKKKRSPSSRTDDDESSEEEDDDSNACDSDEDNSDANDSDWEGAPRGSSNKKKMMNKAGAEASEDTPNGTDRRQTRVRSSCWACAKCTLENNTNDNECVVCGEPRPGYIPAFEEEVF